MVAAVDDADLTASASRVAKITLSKIEPESMWEVDLLVKKEYRYAQV